MARAPLLQLSDIALTHGGAPLFSGVDLVVQPGDRLALVGRNGSGKSTLLRVIAGEVEPDSGRRTLGTGIRAAYLPQEPDLSRFATLGDAAAAGLPEHERHRAEAALAGLGFDPGQPAATASGGERRRAALARLLAEEPDLMLLDEPTNHLDIAAIAWLEETLRAHRAALVVVSHDRAFLRALSTGTLWLDRGVLRRQDRGFDAFEAWRDAVWAEEDAARHKRDRQIAAEARWAVEGISARRKRNQGRLRKLDALRAERRGEIARQGSAALEMSEAPRSGARVIDARGIAKTLGGRRLFGPLSLRIMRGETVAVAGPNGAGKTTLVKVLTGEVAPDEGEVRLGTNLETAVFDQTRDSLDPDATLWDTLTGAADLGISGRSDQILVRGQPKHVVGYLKDFLFDERQARAPVRSLSGGERARLMLARIAARDSNLLVLDEPTNDLDVETLDLLEDVIGSYSGTTILVSHDRDFIDRVATTTLVFDGTGGVTVHAGGWSDAVRELASADGASAPPARTSKPPRAAPASTPRPRTPGLTFTERHRLDALPAKIETLEREIGKLEALLSDATLYARDPEKFSKAGKALSDRQEALRKAEEDWLELAARQEQAGEAG